MMPDLERAAELLRDFGTLWDGATLQERRQIVHTLLQAVYLDSGERGPVVAIEQVRVRAVVRDTGIRQR
jgi:hypothetical protein